MFCTSNIGSSTIKRVDLDFEWRATATTTTPNFDCPYSTTTYRGAAAFAINCSGKPALFSPRWSFKLGLEQLVEVGNFKPVAKAGTR